MSGIENIDIEQPRERVPDAISNQQVLTQWSS